MNTRSSGPKSPTAIPTLLFKQIESKHFSSHIVDFDPHSHEASVLDFSESNFTWVDDIKIYLPKSMERSTKSRKLEYLAGRNAAFRSLTTVGYVPPNTEHESGGNSDSKAAKFFSLPSLPSRAPIWPEGYIGSIAHTKNRAWAVCAKSNVGFQSVGIDLETDIQERTSRDISSKIWTQSEAHILGPHFTPSLGLTITFAAKEALFKALNPLTETYFDFLEAEVTEISQLNRPACAPFPEDVIGTLRLRLLRDLPGTEIDKPDFAKAMGTKNPTKTFSKHSTFSVHFQIVELFQVFVFLAIEPS